MAMPAMRDDTPLLDVRQLDVFYGQAHALQGVSFTLGKGVLAVVGRNGMGKTTLCNAITGLVPSMGSIRLAGQEIRGLPANRITGLGIGYVPQGRRVWPSLTVDEHLRLVERGGRGAWDLQRVYRTFPRLAERRRNGGAQLSGGEQQMLAIARALLLNPRLLVMDEPTEGLAPVIVEQVSEMLSGLAREGDVTILLVEQNLGVALQVADTVAVMVNGRIARMLPAAELSRDHELQQRLLGVTSGSEDTDAAEAAPAPSAEPARVFTVRRAGDDVLPRPPLSDAPAHVRGFTRWNEADPDAPAIDVPVRAARDTEEAPAPSGTGAPESISLAWPESPSTGMGDVVYVAGTFDTKGRELAYLRSCLDRLGVRTVTVDLSTSGKPSSANVGPNEVARHHVRGAHAVFTGDRGSSVEAMAAAFERFILTRRDLGGLISAGGSGGTALATRAMRRLAVGVPKLMVSTVASGDVKPYVGPSDICMMYSVTDVSGINRISERVLANAAHAMAGMVQNARRVRDRPASKPAIGLTMFGVTTPCVQAVTKALEDRYDCLTFHATGTGGQSMEKLADSGLLSAVLDITTTEVADEIVGGVFSAGPERFESVIRTRLPYVGSCGALDMVNFFAMDTVPGQFRGRNLHRHNSNVTLMRTSAEECTRIGRWIAERLNRMEGPVRFVLPEVGVSMLDAPGKPFWDPEADRALFTAIEKEFRPTSRRRLVRTPWNINDPEFVSCLLDQFREIEPAGTVPDRSQSGR